MASKESKIVWFGLRIGASKDTAIKYLKLSKYKIEEAIRIRNQVKVTRLNKQRNEKEIFSKNLLTIPDGLYRLEKEKRFLNFISYYAQYGWLEVKTSKNYKDFMWTSSRNTHDPFELPDMNLTLDIETGRVKFYM